MLKKYIPKFLILALLIVSSVTLVSAEETSYISKNMGLEIPQCDNPVMLKNVSNKIRTYYDENASNKITDKRNQRLLLKYLNSFQEVDVETFKPETNYFVADRILMNKINANIETKDMKLCRSDKIADKLGIYLYIYPQENYYIVEIINFVKNQNNEEYFYTIYE